MKSIGFIGIGVMGKSMAINLINKGYSVFVYTRTKAKADEVVAAGGVWCEDISSCAKDRDAIVTMVGYPKDVQEVYFCDGGILQSAKKGSYLIDMTTTDPSLSIRIYEAAKLNGMYALDAPVSGGDSGAKNATLSIMVGGDKTAHDACLPIFEAMGTNIIYEGKAGSGQHTKMANQIALAGAISGVCEAMTYANAVGLDVQTTLDSIGKGAAGSWQMTNMAPRILNGDFAPGFFIKHYIKDMKIAVENAKAQGLELTVLSDVLSMYQELDSQGKGNDGTQALIKYYQK